MDGYSDLKKAFGIDAMSEGTCFRWHKNFKNGRETCELEGGPGDPVSAITEETTNAWGVTIHTDFSTFYNARCINWQCPFTHKWSFGYVTCCAPWIPLLLTPKVCMVGNVITADESWIYCYDPATKQQSTDNLKDPLQLPDTRHLDGNDVIKRPLSGAH
ncbi:hypothetical protein J6590_091725 [Homalodisca vitripennis]|nr:hypothetical protein J6590_091725 [Homalodisca vitripennis]